MSTLYIRTTSAAAAVDLHAWLAQPWSYAVTVADDVMHSGMQPLDALRDRIAEARRVVVLLAASDVTLLRVITPPLSAAKLKQALPHLVEDQLMGDPEACVLVADAAHDGVRQVAVVQRDALQALAQALRGLGASDIVAVPSQLCLPLESACVHAALSNDAHGVELCIRLSSHEALGVPLTSDSEQQVAGDAMHILQTLVPDGGLILHIAPTHKAIRHLLPEDSDLAARTTPVDEHWSMWIAGAHHATPDLFTGLQIDMKSGIDMRTWRWPLALAASLLVVNVVGLNWQWWSLASEAQRLRTAMMESYRSAYPNDKVVIDPLLQMQQKVAEARRLSGVSADDDFISLAARFGDAWRSIVSASPTSARLTSARLTSAFTAVEYRERALLIRTRDDADEFVGKLKSALAARNLTLSQPEANTWQIRIAK